MSNIETSIKTFADWRDKTYPILDKYLKSDGAASCILSYFNAIRALRSISMEAPDATTVFHAIIDDAYVRKSNAFYLKYGAALDVIYGTCVQSVAASADDRSRHTDTDPMVILRQTAPELYPLEIAGRALFHCAQEGGLARLAYGAAPSEKHKLDNLSLAQATTLMRIELIESGAFD